MNEEVMGGVPVITGTRIPVEALSEMLAQGATAEEIADGYPSLSLEQVRLAHLRCCPSSPGQAGIPSMG